jgi:hypothetical protein
MSPLKTIARPLLDSLLALLLVALLSAVACGGKSTGVAQGSAGSSAGGATGVAGSAVAGAGDAISPGGCDAGNFDADTVGCASNTDCQIVPRGRCSCGSGPISSYIALNSIGILRQDQGCDAVPCAPCGPTTAPDPNDPALYYIATCQAGSCAVVDLRATDVTECKSDSDCGLRAGTGCCSVCGGQTIAVNVSKQADLRKLVCDPEPSGCPECIPAFIGSANCTGGRCSVAPCGTMQNPCPD